MQRFFGLFLLIFSLAPIDAAAQKAVQAKKYLYLIKPFSLTDKAEDPFLAKSLAAEFVAFFTVETEKNHKDVHRAVEIMVDDSVKHECPSKRLQSCDIVKIVRMASSSSYPVTIYSPRRNLPASGYGAQDRAVKCEKPDPHDCEDRVFGGSVLAIVEHHKKIHPPDTKTDLHRQKPGRATNSGPAR